MAAALDTSVAPTVVVRPGGIVVFDRFGKTAQPLVEIYNALKFSSVYSILSYQIKGIQL